MSDNTKLFSVKGYIYDYHKVENYKNPNRPISTNNINKKFVVWDKHLPYENAKTIMKNHPESNIYPDVSDDVETENDRASKFVSEITSDDVEIVNEEMIEVVNV